MGIVGTGLMFHIVISNVWFNSTRLPFGQRLLSQNKRLATMYSVTISDILLHVFPFKYSTWLGVAWKRWFPTRQRERKRGRGRWSFLCVYFWGLVKRRKWGGSEWVVLCTGNRSTEWPRNLVFLSTPWNYLTEVKVFSKQLHLMKYLDSSEDLILRPLTLTTLPLLGHWLLIQVPLIERIKPSC